MPDQVQVTNHLLDTMQFVLQEQVMTEESERLDENSLEFDIRSKADGSPFYVAILQFL